MNPEQAKMWLQFFVNWIEQESQTTRKVLAAVPDDKKNYKPSEKSMTADELAWHIPSSEIWFLRGIIEGQFDATGGPSEKPATIADLVKWYEKNLPEQISRLKALPVDKLLKPIPFFGIMEQPAVMYLPVVTHHSVHHRGQLSAYLRPMGARVPSIYGGSADEPMQAAAEA
jgi:uncharacterized damage-inducible protein DinB